MESIFNKKRRHYTIDGEEIIDLTLPSVNLKKMESNGYIKVQKDQNGRLDKFAYNNISIDTRAIDMVMYYNHIFNPFSICDEDIFYTPVDDDSIFVSNVEPTLPDGSKHSNNVSGEKELTYAEKVERMARIGMGIK